MASAQVDLLNMSSLMPDGNTSSEHVASGSFAPDANALREAALKSRRKKQAAKEQSTAPDHQTTAVNTSQPLVNENSVMGDPSNTEIIDTPMVDVSTPLEKPVDTEDGEIPENTQGNKTDSIDSVEGDPREKTPRPPSTMSPQSGSSLSDIEAPKYVRPGLNMTARDLDEAKHLILDLLGLGVTPEYIVDCGVSPQCIAVCFYELNLRFPLNLDRRQINLPPFYDLDKHMKDSQRREQIIRQRDRGRLPPKPALAAVTAIKGDTGSSGNNKSSPPVSPGLGEKPVLIGLSPIARPLMNIDQIGAIEITGPQLTETAQPPLSKVDITSIEDQKRMELLARKAAIDSITKKRAAKNSGPPAQPATQPQSMEINDVESAVDALLASVRMDSQSSDQSEDNASKGREDEFASNGEQLPDYDSDAMVEDELETGSLSPSDSSTVDQPMDTPVLADTQRNSSPEPIPSSTPALIPSPKPLLSRVRFNAPESVRSSSLPVQPTPIAVPAVARRSRPIASDFIDQAPPRPASASRSGPERTAPLKRKRSFVDPSIWPKRIVIDLDSSDEEDDQDEGAPPGVTGSSSTSSKSNTDRAPSRAGSHDKPVTGGQDLAAQMLLQKELQIKAMMQKIKMRELQKRKSASGSRTPLPTAGTPAATAEPSNAVTPNAEPMSSPAASTVNLTPMATPSSEVPPMIPAAEQATSTPVEMEKYSVLNGSSGTTSPRADKRKGKALEPEGTSQDNIALTATVAQLDSEIRLDQSSSSNSEQAPTHFKAYVSPLAGFTSPNLQRSRPTDQQLSTILWISSPAGQNVDRQLCMYEFPNGTCRNEGCKDIHTRDFGASEDEIRGTVKTMFPNARPESLVEIVTRVRQSVESN